VLERKDIPRACRPASRNGREAAKLVEPGNVRSMTHRHGHRPLRGGVRRDLLARAMPRSERPPPTSIIVAGSGIGSATGATVKEVIGPATAPRPVKDPHVSAKARRGKRTRQRWGTSGGQRWAEGTHRRPRSQRRRSRAQDRQVRRSRSGPCTHQRNSVVSRRKHWRSSCGPSRWSFNVMRT